MLEHASTQAPASSTGDPVVAMHQVSKSFDAVQALTGIDLELRRGEVVGLVGDNGAGKSTLIRSIAGIHQPDAGGEIRIDGVPQVLSAEVARELGIETVHQDLNLIDGLDVVENFFINREIVKQSPLGRLFGWLDRPAMFAEVETAFERAGVRLGPLRRPVRTLSGGQRQVIAVLRAVQWRPRLVMMDEPTAALGVEQSALVLRLIRELADSGIAVLFVSHNMEHVFQVVDRVVVLRQGRKVADLRKEETTAQETVSYITGATGAASLHA